MATRTEVIMVNGQPTGVQTDEQGRSWTVIGGQHVQVTADPEPTPPTAASPRPPAAVTPRFTFPDAVPMAGLGVSASLAPASLDSDSAIPVATGFPMFAETMRLLLMAEESRRADVGQQIQLAGLMSELARTSPTRAAEMATALNLPSLEPDFGWTRGLSGRDTMGTFGGRVGSQDVQLPFTFSGRQMSVFRQEPAMASQVADIADFFGRPGIFERSAAQAVPFSAALLGMAG